MLVRHGSAATCDISGWVPRVVGDADRVGFIGTVMDNALAMICPPGSTLSNKQLPGLEFQRMPNDIHQRHLSSAMHL